MLKDDAGHVFLANLLHCNDLVLLFQVKELYFAFLDFYLNDGGAVFRLIHLVVIQVYVDKLVAVGK